MWFCQQEACDDSDRKLLSIGNFVGLRRRRRCIRRLDHSILVNWREDESTIVQSDLVRHHFALGPAVIVIMLLDHLPTNPLASVAHYALTHLESELSRLRAMAKVKRVRSVA